MAVTTKKSTPTATLNESLWHLERLVNLMLEWQTDWSAISPNLQSGAKNPDFDPEYLKQLREHRETIYNPAVLAAHDFLKRARP